MLDWIISVVKFIHNKKKINNLLGTVGLLDYWGMLNNIYYLLIAHYTIYRVIKMNWVNQDWDFVISYQCKMSIKNIARVRLLRASLLIKLKVPTYKYL